MHIVVVDGPKYDRLLDILEKERKEKHYWITKCELAIAAERAAREVERNELIAKSETERKELIAKNEALVVKNETEMKELITKNDSERTALLDKLLDVNGVNHTHLR